MGPDDRFFHTQNGPLLCGGGSSDDTKTTCLLFSDGQWIVRHHLKYNRYHHTSWEAPDNRVMLIGGSDSSTTTEILTDDGGSSEHFSLKHPSTRSCLIDEGETFLVTGGYDSGYISTVSRYNINGWVEDLDDLITGRANHGCLQYSNNFGARINLVCGGYNSPDRLSSCEINKVGEKTWSPMTSLPGERLGVRGITIGSQVLMMGGYDGSYRDEIYSLDLNTEEWKLVNHLNDERGYHAVSVVSTDYWNFCN